MCTSYGGASTLAGIILSYCRNESLARTRPTLSYHIIFYVCLCLCRHDSIAGVVEVLLQHCFLHRTSCVCVACVQTKLSQFIDTLAGDQLADLAADSTQQQRVDAAQGL